MGEGADTGCKTKLTRPVFGILNNVIKGFIRGICIYDKYICIVKAGDSRIFEVLIGNVRQAQQ